MKSRTLFLALLSLMFVSCSPNHRSVQILSNPSITPAVEDSQPVLPSGMRTLVSIETVEKRIFGEPFNIFLNNCEGMETVTKYLIKGSPDADFTDIKVPQNVIDELGGNVDTARAILKKEIAAQLESKLSPNKNLIPSVSKTIPPKSQINTSVQTKGDWVTGSIGIIRQDGTYVAILPFTSLKNAMLMESDMTIDNCNSPVYPEPLENMSITTTPIFVETMILPGNASDGI